jgi:hypothetical protein
MRVERRLESQPFPLILPLMSFKDHFSTQASSYAKARPTYPRALFAELARLAPGRALAWDAGAGNGQAAVPLGERFERVVATLRLEHAGLAQPVVVTEVERDPEPVQGLREAVLLTLVADAVLRTKRLVLSILEETLLRLSKGLLDAVPGFGHTQPHIGHPVHGRCEQGPELLDHTSMIATCALAALSSRRISSASSLATSAHCAIDSTATEASTTSRVRVLPSKAPAACAAASSNGTTSQPRSSRLSCAGLEERLACATTGDGTSGTIPASSRVPQRSSRQQMARHSPALGSTTTRSSPRAATAPATWC